MSAGTVAAVPLNRKVAVGTVTPSGNSTQLGVVSSVWGPAPREDDSTLGRMVNVSCAVASVEICGESVDPRTALPTYAKDGSG